MLMQEIDDLNRKIHQHANAENEKDKSVQETLTEVGVSAFMLLQSVCTLLNRAEHVEGNFARSAKTQAAQQRAHKRERSTQEATCCDGRARTPSSQILLHELKFHTCKTF
jgi:hypothetical protein